MKKSITKNYIYNLIYEILVLILPLITTPYIARVLGAENIGIYSYTASVATYFILFGSLGIALYGKREIAYYQQDKEKYSKNFWEILILRFVMMTISMLIFYITLVRENQYSTYYAILLLELLGNCLDISWFFQGLEEFKKTVLRNILVRIICITSIFFFVKTSNDLVIYVWIYVLSTLIGNISLWAYLPKYLKKVKIKELNVIQHLKPTIALFIPQIAIQIYTVLDKVMIGAMITDKSEVGYYEQGQRVIKVLLTVITSLGTVMVPRMANIYKNGEKEKLAEYMKKAINYVFLISFPMIFGVMSISKAFVPVFFGENYDKVAILMNIISPILLIIGLSNAIGTQFLLPTKRQKEYTISVVIGACVNFIANLILIGRYASIGASIGTVIAELCVTSIQIYCIRKIIDLKSILKMSIRYLVASIIMCAGSMTIGTIINNNIYAIIVQVFVGVVIYGSILLILKDEFIYSILNKIKRKENKT